MSRELDVEQIRSLLEELGRRLDDRGVQARLYLVGGAAIAVAINPRRVTDDIDGLFEPYSAVTAVVAEMAAEHDLEPDWLNSRAFTFIAASEPGNVYMDVPGLSVTTASPEHLLAMKMAAYRQQDLEDLKVLFRTIGITTAEEAVEITYTALGGADNDYASMFGDRDEYHLRARAILAALERSDKPGPGASGGS